MTFYTIRLKRYPHLYVGKKNPYYALTSDASIQKLLRDSWPKTIDEALQIDAYWFVHEERAKVWTNLTSLKRFLSYCAGKDDDGNRNPLVFSEYEFLRNRENFVDTL
jgi:hypothetical protein